MPIFSSMLASVSSAVLNTNHFDSYWEEDAVFHVGNGGIKVKQNRAKHIIIALILLVALSSVSPPFRKSLYKSQEEGFGKETN